MNLEWNDVATRHLAEIDEVLEPKGVAVVIEASHGCMSSRGVNQHGGSLVTKCWLGEFHHDRDLRRDFMESIRP